MLIAALLALGAPAATVTVNGGNTCVSAMDVEFALDEVDGLLASDRVLVDLVRLTDPWTMHVRVVRREVEVWSRSLQVRAADCPLLPAALARTMQRGLEGVPRWPFADESRWLLGVQTTNSWPYVEWGAAVTFGRGPRPRGVWSWEIDAGAFTRALQPVGTGRASLSGFCVGLGPIAEAPLASVRLGLRPRIGVGVGRAQTSGFTNQPDDPDAPRSAPRLTAALEAQLRIPQGLHVGLRGTWVAVRSGFVDNALGSVTTAPEPRLRLGFVIGLRGAVGK